MNYFLAALKKYADFKGRSRRKEYWYFVLFYMLIYFVVIAATFMLQSSIPAGIFVLTMLVPTLAVGVRRMHDVDKSGWYLLIPIYSLVLACTEGTPGINQYGEDPKNPAMLNEIDQIGTNMAR